MTRGLFMGKLTFDADRALDFKAELLELAESSRYDCFCYRCRYHDPWAGCTAMECILGEEEAMREVEEIR